MMKTNLSGTRILFAALALLFALALAAPAVRAQDSTNEVPLGDPEQEEPTDGFDTLSSKPGGGSVTTDRTGGPESIVFDGTYVWIPRQFKNALVRVRAADGAKGGSFSVGRGPVALLYAAGSIWSANLADNTVTKLRATDGAHQGTFAVGAGPGALGFDGANVWVANRNADTVTKLRASDGANLGTFKTGGRRPMGVACREGVVWVTNNLDDTVARLRASDGALLGTHAVGDGPYAVAAAGTDMVVSNFFGHSLTRLSAAGAVLGTYKVGHDPAGLFYDGANLWVALSGDNLVAKVRPSDGVVLATYKTGQTPLGVFFDGANVWSVNFSSDSISTTTAVASPGEAEVY